MFLFNTQLQNSEFYECLLAPLKWIQLRSGSGSSQMKRIRIRKRSGTKIDRVLNPDYNYYGFEPYGFMYKIFVRPSSFILSLA